ncbi:MAG TPA: IS91 family transposase [Streptosporangiaceae bacterium]|nr:IS91 family transposase [Streptosporangiaceae bacterium]
MATARAARRVELADLVRAHGAAYRRMHRLTRGQHRALRAIGVCRTAALGGHAEACEHCGTLRIAYNSCRNRHCPKCQTLAKERWVTARRAELLPVEYFHVVFTLPHALNPLAQGNPRILYGLLFQAARESLAAFGADPRHLGGEVGGLAILHTWGQSLEQHLHLHCVVPGGALARDGTRWLPAKPRFLFPVRALARVFRGKYLAGLQQAFARGTLRFAGSVAGLAAPLAFQVFVGTLRTQDWVVYAKPPFAGPTQVLEYLGRYTHRVAISNDRLVSVADGQVRFRWKDYAHGSRLKTMTLAADEFLRRFLLHVLPGGFVRIRHFGFLANRGRTGKLARCRVLLAVRPPETPAAAEPVAALMRRLTGVDIEQCSVCHTGRLRVVAVFRPGHLPAPALDSS